MEQWKEVGRIVYDSGKRRCTLKDMEDSVAELSSVVRKMKDRGVGARTEGGAQFSVKEGLKRPNRYLAMS